MKFLRAEARKQKDWFHKTPLFSTGEKVGCTVKCSESDFMGLLLATGTILPESPLGVALHGNIASRGLGNVLFKSEPNRAKVLATYLKRSNSPVQADSARLAKILKKMPQPQGADGETE